MRVSGPDNKTKLSSQGKVKLPGEAYSPKIRARFWIVGDATSEVEGSSEAYVGIGRIELLENIERLGSMSQAAKAMGMSYKKAWKLVQDLNGMYAEPLVVKEHGGKSGGGTQLTDKGKALITEFRALEKDLAVFLEAQSSKII